jgi:cobalamin biosynthesis Mg chelatase CobN
MSTHTTNPQPPNPKHQRLIPNFPQALESAGGIDAGESAVEECAKVMRDGGMMAGYVSELRGYLQELEQRLFSAGLHVLGEAPKVEEMRQYLEAFFQDGDWKQGGKSSTDGEVVIEDDGEEQSPRGMPFPDAVFDKIVGGAKEADVLSFRGAGVPMDGTPERDVYAGGCHALVLHSLPRNVRLGCMQA